MGVNMKNKRPVSVIVILAFLQLTVSCSIHKTTQRKPDEMSGAKARTRPIVRVLMKSGETIEFPKGDPGYLLGDKIVGTAKTKTVKVKGNLGISKEGDIHIIRLASGETYRARSYRLIDNDSRLVMELEPTPPIPLSDVELVWTRQTDAALSVLAALGGVALVAGAVVLIVALTKQSCPFLYSHDGSGYTLEGELYSGAILPEIERGDILKLHYLSPVSGRYLLKIANEAMETQCTDELTLLAVDHPKDVDVFAGPDGRVRTVGRPLLGPTSATDFDGRDFTAIATSSDGRMWSSNPFGRDPEDPGSWTSGLVLRFPKPAEAARAKLVVRIGNTHWADIVFARFFGMMGTLAQPWLRSAGSDPSVREKTDKFMREQGIGLKTQVRGPDGWRDAGFFYPTGPFGIKDDILELDLGGVPGETLEVRLQGGTFFWMVDRAGVDYSEDVTVAVHALSAREAVDETGKDVREALRAPDGAHFTMPEPGGYAFVKFTAPPEAPGLERSFLLKSRGYYTIHPQGEPGKPDLAKLLAIRENPALFLKFSLQELLKTFSARADAALPAKDGALREEQP